MLRGKGGNGGQDFRNGMIGAFRLPGRVIGIAEPAAEIAAAGANERRGHADQSALALDRIEKLRAKHGFMIQDRRQTPPPWRSKFPAPPRRIPLGSSKYPATLRRITL